MKSFITPMGCNFMFKKFGYTNLYRIVPEDSHCSIKVVAICSEGLLTEFTIEEPFSVEKIAEGVYIFFIILFAFITLIPELYLDKKLSNFVNRNQKMSVEIV